MPPRRSLRQKAVAANAAARKSLATARFPPERDITAEIAGTLRRPHVFVTPGARRPSANDLRHPNRAVYDGATLLKLTPQNKQRLLANLNASPLAFTPERVTLHSMNRLKSGVTQCIAWLRANIGSKKYAALVETRSGAMKSSGWLAAEAAKRLGAPTSLVVVDTVRSESGGLYPNFTLMRAGMDRAYAKGVRNFVHIDDFIGTGHQKSEMVFLAVPWLKKHPGCTLWVCAAFATTEGVRAVENVSTPAVKLYAAHTAPRTSIFPHKIPNAHTLGEETHAYVWRHINAPVPKAY